MDRVEDPHVLDTHRVPHAGGDSAAEGEGEKPALSGGAESQIPGPRDLRARERPNYTVRMVEHDTEAKATGHAGGSSPRAEHTVVGVL